MSQNFNSETRDWPAPFGIYVHLPFCIHKCSYCDFYSFAAETKDLHDPLVTKVEWEIQASANWLKAEGKTPSPAVSVFFGGGTPSLISINLIGRLLSSLFGNFAIQDDAEITLETNPETVTDEFCEGVLGLRKINRLSLGAQSFSPTLLKTLERLCSRESIHAAIKKIRSHGIRHYNLDLIFGIPGQTKQGMLDDIHEAASLEPEHISFYNLTLKPGHPLYRSLPDDDTSADWYEAGVEELAKMGYKQYEISNFSRTGVESRHNQLYWNGGNFLGVGPSAASRFFWDGRFHHRKQYSDIHRYFAVDKFLDPAFESTTSSQTVLEAAFLELRVNQGISLSQFSRRYGYDFTTAKKFETFVKEGLVVREADRLRLSSRGRLLADRVTEELVD